MEFSQAQTNSSATKNQISLESWRRHVFMGNRAAFNFSSWKTPISFGRSTFCLYSIFSKHAIYASMADARGNGRYDCVCNFNLTLASAAPARGRVLSRLAHLLSLAPFASHFDYFRVTSRI